MMKQTIHFNKTPDGFTLTDTSQNNASVSITCDYNSMDDFADFFSYIYNGAYNWRGDIESLMQYLTFAGSMYYVGIR